MPSNEKHGKLKVAIVVSSIDNSTKAAEIAIWFSRYKSFDLEIVGCSTLSLFDLPVAGAAIGIPIPGFAVKQSIRCARAEVQDVCNEVISILDKDTSVDIKPKLGYIGGPLNQIVPCLVSTFDVVIIPHRLKLAMKFRIRRPVLDTLIMKSKKIPVLFCTDTSVCGRIVATQVDSCIGFQARQILNCLSNRLRVPIYQWFPKQSVDSVPSSETGKKKLSGIPNSCELDEDSVFTDQNGTLLAVPSALILSIFRFHKFRLLLSNWNGNFLVLP
jgi:hypothetical protein